MWPKKSPVDLATRWAQQEPFQGHGGGGSRLQWVEEGVGFNKADWRQLFLKISAKKRRQKLGRWLERGSFYPSGERTEHVYEPCGKNLGPLAGERGQKECR